MLKAVALPSDFSWEKDTQPVEGAPAQTGTGPQQTAVPNLQDVKPAGPGMAAAHSIGNGLTFGLPDQIMARHLADKYQIPLDQAFGLIKQHFASGESQLPKGL